MQIDRIQSVTTSPATGQLSAASNKASQTLVQPQQEFLQLSQEAERLAQQNPKKTDSQAISVGNDSVKVTASTGQSQAQGSLTEQQAIALYRKIASLL